MFSSLSLVIVVRPYIFTIKNFTNKKQIMARHEVVTANIVASSTSVLQLVKVIGSRVGGTRMLSGECI